MILNVVADDFAFADEYLKSLQFETTGNNIQQHT